MSIGGSHPSAEEQVAFVAKLQRLFSEGDFTATYKFALLMALADLAVETGRDDAGRLRLSIRQIAQQFIALYWRHVGPYSSGRPGSVEGVLVQNLGAQAAVLTAIAEFRRASGSNNLSEARETPQFERLVSRVAAIVSAQPVKYLQNFGGSTDEFLYRRDGNGFIALQPGVGYCLRRYYPLVQRLSTAGWIEHIKSNQRNHPMLGERDDLEDFLFSTSRKSLGVIQAGLQKIDGGRCFYCGLDMDQIDVDHYVPFSLYPRDLAHNFVLAHPRCNRSKSDALAAKQHLERWLKRLRRQADAISEVAYAAGVGDDTGMTLKVACWAYGNAASSGAHAWQAPRHFEVVDVTYLDLLICQ